MNEKQNTTSNTPDSNEARQTTCANCGDKLYQTADPNDVHWYHAVSGDVRCPTRFAKPSRAAVAAVEGDVTDVLRRLFRRIPGPTFGPATPDYGCNYCKGRADLPENIQHSVDCPWDAASRLLLTAKHGSPNDTCGNCDKFRKNHHAGDFCYAADGNSVRFQLREQL